ncbi:hypothetical protein H8959_001234, partial [Pygathrix nigripes]
PRPTGRTLAPRNQGLSRPIPRLATSPLHRGGAHVVRAPGEAPGLRERGSACAGALPALPRRCGHCPTPVRLRPLWAAPQQIRIGDNRACGGGGRLPEALGGPEVAKSGAPQRR